MFRILCEETIARMDCLPMLSIPCESVQICTAQNSRFCWKLTIVNTVLKLKLVDSKVFYKMNTLLN